MIKLFLPKFWYRRELLSYILLPFSFVYRIFIDLSRFYYRFLPPKKFPLPIIVVGNITVGGTGKTPLVIALANLLLNQGYKPGIISRGYGRKKPNVAKVVMSNSSTEEVGDEALLISHRTGLPVVVCNDRFQAAKILLAQDHCDVLISDDGLQHHSLPRNIEIALVDASFGFGNKFCLPAGPLREPISRLKSVDFVIRNFNASEPTRVEPKEYWMMLEPLVFRNIKDPTKTKNANDFKGETVHAVAGIGMPEKFFQTLRKLGLTIIEHPFPDHYQFHSQDLTFTNGVMLMTEKDAVKCVPLAGENFWYLEVQAKLDNLFIEKLLKKLKEYNTSIQK